MAADLRNHLTIYFLCQAEHAMKASLTPAAPLPYPPERENIIVHIGAGRQAEARRLAEQVITHAKNRHGEASLSHAVALVTLAEVLLVYDYCDDAVSLLESAMGSIVNEFGRYSQAAAFVAGARARAEVRRLKLDREAAETAISTEMAIYDSLGGENYSYFQDVLSNLATLHVRCNRVDDAERFAVRALQLCAKHLGKSSGTFVSLLIQLAGIYSLQGRFLAARCALERVLRLRVEGSSVHNGALASALFELGKLDELEGKYTSAQDRFTLARALSLHTLPPNHQNIETLERYLKRVANRERTDFGSA